METYIIIIAALLVANLYFAMGACVNPTYDWPRPNDASDRMKIILLRIGWPLAFLCSIIDWLWKGENPDDEPVNKRS